MVPDRVIATLVTLAGVWAAIPFGRLLTFTVWPDPQPNGERMNKQKGKRLSLECIESNAAGIDVGATEIYVAVPAERDTQPVRCFPTFTVDLRQMAAWLVQCGITTVAMESTGVYWLPPYEILEEAGIRVCLVNSKHVKHVPGRKSDVSDCQWLQYLHSVGLLRSSFRPEGEICAIRSLSRPRASRVENAAVHIQHMHKALVGNYRSEHLFTLKQSLIAYRN
jgi:transposase